MASEHVGRVYEQLNQTGIGKFILKHKALLMLLVLVSIVAVMVWGTHNYIQNKRDIRFGSLIYDFDQQYVEKLKKNELEPNVFIDHFRKLVSEVAGFRGVVPLSIKISDELVGRGNLEEAKSVLEATSENLSRSNPFVNWFLQTRLASLYEDLQDNQNAIRSLEKLTTSSVKVMEGKVYLDLGRLYLKEGDKDKSRLNLQHVLDHFSDTEYAKLAQLYLIEMDKQ